MQQRCGWDRQDFIQSFIIQIIIVFVYCTQSARETTVNESRPCPCGAPILLREGENEKAKVAND